MTGPDHLPAPTFVRLDDATAATYVLEPPGGDAVADVVLGHGTPWSAATWAPVARRLARRHRVHLWDMPGYGASIDPETRTVDLVAQRRRLTTLLAHWRLERPHVVAHDVGGAVALGAHLLEGRAFASLYLLDVVTVEPWGSPFFRLVAEHEDVFAALPLTLHAALVREYVAGAGHALDEERADDLARPWCTPAGQAAFYRQVAQLRPADTRPVEAGLGRVRCPVRVGWGELDPWLPPHQATELADRLPGQVDVVTFPGVGHLVPLEATEALTDDLLAWLP